MNCWSTWFREYDGDDCRAEKENSGRVDRGNLLSNAQRFQHAKHLESAGSSVQLMVQGKIVKES
jgi:hypothetical protein